MKHSIYSAVIIGSGIAGLYAAIKLSETKSCPDGILVLTKANLNECNSRYAQGGIVGVMPENKLDSTSLHIKDTLKSGCGLSNLNVTKYISENSNIVIKDLLSYGIDFDRNEKNELNYTLEGAHSVKRVIHAGGDATGFYMEKALVAKVKSKDNIKIYEQALAVELLVDNDNICRGIIIFNTQNNEYEIIYAGATILSTGGAGQVFQYTTNPTVATGDGIAIAYKANAVIENMEFVQFHPTSLAKDTGKTRFLISEAVRGEGARLCDIDGNYFMQKYDDRKDLAPRDIVTRAIFKEMKETKYNCVYLDATKISAKKQNKRFPNIKKICAENGIDITKNYIPVSPSAHYLMGGIKTDINAQSSISGLYAIGETACTELHGANRLASNSLLECVVSAFAFVENVKNKTIKISKCIDENILTIINQYEKPTKKSDLDLEKLKYELQHLMWENVGIERNEKSLMKAQKAVQIMQKEFNNSSKCASKEEYEYRNLLINALIIINCALSRKESRGAHYRNDFPKTLDGAKNTLITMGIINEQLSFK